MYMTLSDYLSMGLLICAVISLVIAALGLILNFIEYINSKKK